MFVSKNKYKKAQKYIEEYKEVLEKKRTKIDELKKELSKARTQTLGKLNCKCENCGKDTILVLHPASYNNPRLIERVHTDTLKKSCQLYVNCKSSYDEDNDDGE